MWTVTEPAEIERRLARGQCLSCSYVGLNIPAQIDPATGFFYTHCASCRQDIARHKPPTKGPSAAKQARDHKAEGIANLDRLTGNG